MNPFYGKYRGTVTDNQDPSQMGRIRARVPAVLGGSLETGWAMPCFPFAGAGMGFVALPKVGAGVWIEFEGGNPEFPIWSGCWYGSAADLPSAALSPPYKKVLLRTEGGQSLILDDSPGAGGILLETSGGQKIKLTSSGIELDNSNGAKITLQGAKVDVNSGALEIT